MPAFCGTAGAAAASVSAQFAGPFERCIRHYHLLLLLLLLQLEGPRVTVAAGDSSAGSPGRRRTSCYLSRCSTQHRAVCTQQRQSSSSSSSSAQHRGVPGGRQQRNRHSVSRRPVIVTGEPAGTWRWVEWKKGWACSQHGWRLQATQDQYKIGAAAAAAAAATRWLQWLLLLLLWRRRLARQRDTQTDGRPAKQTMSDRARYD